MPSSPPADASVPSDQIGISSRAPIAGKARKTNLLLHASLCWVIRDRTGELGAPLSPVAASTPAVCAIAATGSRSSTIEVFHRSRRLWHGCVGGRYEPYDKSWNPPVLLIERWLWKAFRPTPCQRCVIKRASCTGIPDPTSRKQDASRCGQIWLEQLRPMRWTGSRSAFARATFSTAFA